MNRKHDREDAELDSFDAAFLAGLVSQEHACRSLHQR